jgi:hypothetical protein
MTCGASANTASSPAPLHTRRCQVTDISPETVSDGSFATNSTGSPALPRPLAPPGRRTAGPQQVAHTLGPLRGSPVPRSASHWSAGAARRGRSACPASAAAPRRAARPRARARAPPQAARGPCIEAQAGGRQPCRTGCEAHRQVGGLTGSQGRRLQGDGESAAPIGVRDQGPRQLSRRGSGMPVAES